MLFKVQLNIDAQFSGLNKQGLNLCFIGAAWHCERLCFRFAPVYTGRCIVWLRRGLLSKNGTVVVHKRLAYRIEWHTKEEACKQPSTLSNANKSSHEAR